MAKQERNSINKQISKMTTNSKNEYGLGYFQKRSENQKNCLWGALPVDLFRCINIFFTSKLVIVQFIASVFIWQCFSPLSLPSFFLSHFNPSSLYSLWLWQPPSPSHASTVRLGFIACRGGCVAVAGWVRYFNTWISWLWIYADEDSFCPSEKFLLPLLLEHTLLPPLHDYDLTVVHSLSVSLLHCPCLFKRIFGVQLSHESILTH